MKTLLKIFTIILFLITPAYMMGESSGGSFIYKQSRMMADNYILDKAEKNNILYILAIGDEYDYNIDEYYNVYKLIIFNKQTSLFIDEKILIKIPYHVLGPTPEKIVLKRDGVYVRWLTYDEYYNEKRYLKKVTDYYGNTSSNFTNFTNNNKDLYASLAISTKRYKYGYAFQYDSLSEANQRALNECNRLAGDNSCFTLVWAKNQCIAFAGYGSSYGWGKANEKYVAEQYALDYCKQYSGRNCNLLLSICADGR